MQRRILVFSQSQQRQCSTQAMYEPMGPIPRCPQGIQTKSVMIYKAQAQPHAACSYQHHAVRLLSRQRAIAHQLHNRQRQERN